MSNGKLLNDLAEFEQNMKVMTDRQLMEFTARQVYTHEGRLKSLEKINARALTIGGGVGGGVAGTIIVIIRALGG